MTAWRCSYFMHCVSVAMLVKLLLLLCAFTTATSRHVNFYRKDYTYVEEYDAYYKLHWDHNAGNWSSTFLTCDAEGAELFYPKSAEEWTVAKKLAQTLPVPPNVTDIFVGIHDKFGIGEFLTINGRPTSSPILHLDTRGEDRCVTMNIETGLLVANECIMELELVRPYVCKKIEDVTCPTIDKGYKFVRETKKCYKKNEGLKSWSGAMQTCYMEGGILVVVTSDLEAEALRTKIIDDDTYYAGFKRIFPNNEFYTVTGHKLHDSGYEKWYNEDYRYNYNCGVLSKYYKQLYMKSVNCDTELPFICEMDVSL